MDISTAIARATMFCPAAMADHVDYVAGKIMSHEGRISRVWARGSDVCIEWEDCEGDDGEAPYGARTTWILRHGARVILTSPTGKITTVLTTNDIEQAKRTARQVAPDAVKAGYTVRIRPVDGWRL